MRWKVEGPVKQDFIEAVRQDKAARNNRNTLATTYGFSGWQDFKCGWGFVGPQGPLPKFFMQSDHVGVWVPEKHFSLGRALAESMEGDSYAINHSLTLCWKLFGYKLTRHGRQYFPRVTQEGSEIFVEVFDGIDLSRWFSAEQSLPALVSVG